MDFIRSFFGLPQRIKELEVKIAELEVAQMKARLSQSISLVSPNGNRKISILCHDDTAGIWISNGPGEPMVAIYNDDIQGAVVGIWGQADSEGNRRGGLDVALSHSPNTGGNVQIISSDNRLADIDAETVGASVSLGETRTKF